MNKFLFLIFFYFLCSSTIANAGIDEAGSGNWCQLYNKGIKLAEENQKNKIKKNKKYSMIYAACEIDGLAYQSYFGNNLEKLKKKTYKKCMKRAKKSNLKDCYIFSLNGEVLWQKKYDWDKGAKRAKLLADKEFTSSQNYSDTEIERRIKKKLILSYKDSPQLDYIKEEDNKAGRSLVDRPDVNDDFQIHFIYLLDKKTKDKEWDINGDIEKLTAKANDKLLKITAKNKKSNGVGQKFKYDFTKDGKLDVSFVRMNFSQKDVGYDNRDGNSAQGYYDYVYNLGFNNPKKLYILLPGFKSLIQNQTGEGGPGYAIVHNLKSSRFKKTMIHEAFHSNGAVYGCGKSAKKNDAHMKTNSDIMGSNSNNYIIDAKNNSYYRHSIEGCPDLANSVYLTPTSENSWDPYDVFCRANYKNFTHKKAFIFPRGRNGRMCKIKKLSLIQ